MGSEKLLLKECPGSPMLLVKKEEEDWVKLDISKSQLIQSGWKNDELFIVSLFGVLAVLAGLNGSMGWWGLMGLMGITGGLVAFKKIKFRWFSWAMCGFMVAQAMDIISVWM